MREGRGKERVEGNPKHEPLRASRFFTQREGRKSLQPVRPRKKERGEGKEQSRHPKHASMLIDEGEKKRRASSSTCSGDKGEGGEK